MLPPCISASTCDAGMQAHDDRNEARKLTPAERKEKRVQKLTGEAEDTGALLVAVYAVLDLSSTQHQWKVRVNAEVLPLCSRAQPGVVASALYRQLL